MIYLLAGENVDDAVAKLRAIRAAFTRKNEHGPIAEIEGAEATDADMQAAIGGGSLFSKNRLVIFKRMGSASSSVQKMLDEYQDFFQKSNDVFVFWETDSKSELCTLLKKHATKSQAVDRKSETKTVLFRPNVFAAVDNILERSGFRFRESTNALRDIEVPDLFSVLFWKLRTIFLATHGE